MAKKKNGRVKSLADLPKPLSYRFEAIRVIEYRGQNADDLLGTQIILNFNVKCGFGLSLEPQAIAIFTDVTGTLKDHPEREICFLRIQTIFPIDGLSAYVEGDKVPLPEELMGTIIGLTVGAARGILYSKNFGSIYGDIVMPAINVEDLIPKVPFFIGNGAPEIRGT